MWAVLFENLDSRLDKDLKGAGILRLKRSETLHEFGDYAGLFTKRSWMAVGLGDKDGRPKLDLGTCLYLYISQAGWSFVYRPCQTGHAKLVWSKSQQTIVWEAVSLLGILLYPAIWEDQIHVLMAFSEATDYCIDRQWSNSVFTLWL